MGTKCPLNITEILYHALGITSIDFCKIYNNLIFIRAHIASLKRKNLEFTHQATAHAALIALFELVGRKVCADYHRQRINQAGINYII